MKMHFYSWLNHKKSPVMRCVCFLCGVFCLWLGLRTTAVLFVARTSHHRLSNHSIFSWRAFRRDKFQGCALLMLLLLLKGTVFSRAQHEWWYQQLLSNSSWCVEALNLRLSAEVTDGEQLVLFIVAAEKWRLGECSTGWSSVLHVLRVHYVV